MMTIHFVLINIFINGFLLVIATEYQWNWIFFIEIAKSSPSTRLADGLSEKATHKHLQNQSVADLMEVMTSFFYFQIETKTNGSYFTTISL